MCRKKIHKIFHELSTFVTRMEKFLGMGKVKVCYLLKLPVKVL